jgi:S-adenosylmethionine-diacylglycerol 3-amino-3-carboxypropyl transferase
MTAAQLNTKTIWYSASNEDTRSESAALAPAGKSLLCITASGSRTFDLLIGDPARIVSIDQNPAQTAFALVLAAAYRRLSYPAFRGFVGLDDNKDRGQTLATLMPDLPADAARFWHGNARAVENGLLYCGKWEGYLRQIQQLAGARRRRLAQQLLSAPSLAEQHALWNSQWDDRGWRLFLKMLAQRWLWTYVFREPGMAFVERGFDIQGYAQSRFDHVARNLSFSQSPFAWLLMQGHYQGDILPPYLTETGFELIRSKLDRVSFVTASLQDTLNQCDRGAFDGASLSDYSSYCDVSVQRGVWRSLARAMAPKGRVCERKFFNKSGTHLPTEFGFARDSALEDQLFFDDQAFFYSFVVAERMG